MGSSAAPHARLLFQEAFDKLEKTVRNINPEDAHKFSDTTLQDVHNASIDIEEALAKRKCLRNLRRLNPFLASLDHYSKSIEVICNGTPYLPWIWAPIKLMLQITSEFPAAMDKLIATYGKIAEVMPRFDKLSAAFKCNSDFQRILAIVYSDILDFHQQAYCFFRRNGWKFFFGTLFGKFDRCFKDILHSLAENCRLVEIEANTADIVEASIFRRRMQDESDKAENERAVRQLQAVLTWLDVRDEEQENELDRLYGLLHEHSCDWVQQHDQARAWMSMGGRQPALWLTGKPGAGKSVLSAAVIQFLMRDRQSTVLYYFCSFRSSEGNQSAHVLRTLMAELLRVNNDVAAYVYDEYIVKGRPPSIPRLKQLLQSLLSTVPSTRIILDGIDELESGDQIQILGDVLPLATVKDPKASCKVLISSRRILEILSIMSKYPTLDLSREHSSTDRSITSFVRHELGGLCTKLGQAHGDASPIIKEVEQEIIEKAEGMFLWVRLVLHALKNSHSFFELRNTVHELPRGVDCMYTRILRRIMDDLGEEKRKAVLSILSWVVHAIRPLKNFELISALSLRFDSASDRDQEIVWDWVLDLCGPLLEETRSGTWILVHFTVREYFVNGTGVAKIDPLKASLEICLGCLSCLIQGLDFLDPKKSLDQQTLEVIGGRYGLSKYSVDFWLTHLLNVLHKTNDGMELDDLLKFLDALHDKNQTIEDSLSPQERKPTGDIEASDMAAFPHGLLNLPHLTEIVLNFLSFEKDLKQQKFSSGRDVDAFTLEHDPTLLSQMLQKYKKIIGHMMQPDRGSEATQSHPQRFKQEFVKFAFFCRFWGCGEYFPTAKKLEEHELFHSGGIKCIESSCPFSRIGFTSSLALRSHVRKYHSPQQPGVSITSVRRKYVCSGVVDGTPWGCGRRFVVQTELESHIASRPGTNCDHEYIRDTQQRVESTETNPAQTKPKRTQSLSMWWKERKERAAAKKLEEKEIGRDISRHID